MTMAVGGGGDGLMLEIEICSLRVNLKVFLSKKLQQREEEKKRREAKKNRFIQHSWYDMMVSQS